MNRKIWSFLLSLLMLVSVGMTPMVTGTADAANKIYYAPIALTGGASNALDYIDGATLADGDFAHVTVSGIIYVYKLNASLGASESSPQIIVPDTNPGAKCWVLQRQFYSSQQLIDNLSFTATVSSKALTVALKGADGNAPSTSNPASIGFRSATLTDGKPVIRTVTAATSVVLPSGGTLGFTAAGAGRLYVWAIDNAGTVELSVSRTADIFPEANLVTTVAINSGSDLATVMYSTTQRTSLACRCIGYVEITTGGTAGEWDNAATKVQVMGPGVKRTGDVIQTAYASSSAVVSGNTVIPWDDTVPQNTEGDEYLTKAITPTSTLNRLYIQGYLNMASDTDSFDEFTTALFQDTTAGALAATGMFQPTGMGTAPFGNYISHTMIAGTTAATTFKLRYGHYRAARINYMNGVAAERKYGGVAESWLKITEVME